MKFDAHLDHLRGSPRETGELTMIVRRPKEGEREVLEEGTLDADLGLVGDDWRTRSTVWTDDGSPHYPSQITVMNTRVAELIAGDRTRWALAGDQLFVDLDLSRANLPPGTRLAIGDAVLEVSDDPHTGCKKFVSRFGLDAMKFVNSSIGRELNLRGINTRVIRGGRIRLGDAVRKLAG